MCVLNRLTSNMRNADPGGLGNMSIWPEYVAPVGSPSQVTSQTAPSLISAAAAVVSTRCSRHILTADSHCNEPRQAEPSKDMKTGVWSRMYTAGITIVNPTADPQAIQLPATGPPSIALALGAPLPPRVLLLCCSVAALFASFRPLSSPLLTPCSSCSPIQVVRALLLRCPAALTVDPPLQQAAVPGRTCTAVWSKIRASPCPRLAASSYFEPRASRRAGGVHSWGGCDSVVGGMWCVTGCLSGGSGGAFCFLCDCFQKRHKDPARVVLSNRSQHAWPRPHRLASPKLTEARSAL